AHATNTAQKLIAEPIQRSITTPAILRPQQVTQTQPAPQVEITTKEHESTTALVSEEDVVIFEQMRHQLVVWTRVEAVHDGIDIAGHEPAELVELLQQFDGLDESRLQVTFTLINLCYQHFVAVRCILFLFYQTSM